MPKILLIFGTRPEAIKMAPVYKILKDSPEFETLVAVTAQHREMLDQVLKLFNITPDYDLNLMTPRQTLQDLTSRALLGVSKVLDECQPDLVLVHGDTTTTFVGALAAFYKKIPVGHVEAGLRTRNKYSPWPEEMNRRLTGALTDLHFAPTRTSRENLLREGVLPENIFVTGNTVIDALYYTVRENYRFDPEIEAILNRPGRIILMTTHRRENWGEPLKNIYRGLLKVLEEAADVRVIFPVHKNPVVREAVKEVIGEHPRVHLVEPMDYEPFANLMARSYLVLTDSGGIQEEAPSLGKPVLVLRDTTERPEAVEAGTVRLIGSGTEAVYKNLKELLFDESSYQKMANAVNPYGDGKASLRIYQALKYYYKIDQAPPEEFSL
ncbi:non-hydrolyzing UDP-N-acetylglucosamine 2-epimerase [Carboxydothermus ferrireducens]|uniref:UDP-N-acetylglucosamine 2-epimerase (non-hydrolyzing) n=1 Tax=Carboxydothermus ferrireducens DSM 11255 TaxID=1119529 RepID=A0ABX2R9V9_9THEO|nr:UDP-N-acetylglucosamine 2-epimerase (non-hydrolyzing) [Carboxydothermus ferrireducens]NYE57710.1 UDP-N-acetylglucosamine 2-epimerase (non-hydrolyzing) [Carboxydothermus ferrireducens DSM 11255]